MHNLQNSKAGQNQPELELANRASQNNWLPNKTNLNLQEVELDQDLEILQVWLNNWLPNKTNLNLQEVELDQDLEILQVWLNNWLPNKTNLSHLVVELERVRVNNKLPWDRALKHRRKN